MSGNPVSVKLTPSVHIELGYLLLVVLTTKVTEVEFPERIVIDLILSTKTMAHKRFNMHVKNFHKSLNIVISEELVTASLLPHSSNNS